MIIAKINCDPLDDVNGNLPGRSPKDFSVVQYGVILVAIVSFISSFSSSGNGQRSRSVGCWVLWRFYLSNFKWSKHVATVGAKIFVIKLEVNPGHEWKLPFQTAFRKVAMDGEKHAAW